ncbi:MAG TPA: 30S ribosomal protein S8 [Actinomycetota bacterium]|jgi:small subunit ribosomal protein S8|nr:30S ribosomal protein S8 [Actinomycetota bacterium]
MLTDPIADMLTRIRNANTAYKEEVEIPASRLKEEVARVLAREGYVQGFRLDGEEPKRRIVVEMKYGPDRERTISGLKRVSRPGRRVYVDRGNLPRVLGGLGVSILSTSQGLLTDRQAARRGVGGEVLCQVW